MIIAAFLLMTVSLLILQTTVFPLLPAWLGKPDLLFILVVYLAYRVETIKGAVIVFLIGLFTDVFSGLFLGLSPAVYLLVFFLLKAFSKHLALNESTYQVPFTIISYLFSSTAIFLSASILAPENTLIWSWRTMVLQMLLLAIISLPLFGIYEIYLEFCTKKLAHWRPIRLKGGNRFRS